MAQIDLTHLTPQQRTILRLWAQRKTQQEAADIMGMSRYTMRDQRRRLSPYMKLLQAG